MINLYSNIANTGFWQDFKFTFATAAAGWLCYGSCCRGYTGEDLQVQILDCLADTGHYHQQDRIDDRSLAADSKLNHENADEADWENHESA